ncbi:hypothetical protein ABIB25_002735 [Nakamurella sp. UYEF19]|uniref:hypothetical protein n=1 Tax=Nakamurella sp. UYEF19 TaxID=1756392 RepID=UPI00339371D8
MDTTHTTRTRTRWSMLIDRLGAPSARDCADAPPISPAPLAHHGHWNWLFADEMGLAVEAPRASFSSQDTAEDWLEANADSLGRLGVSAATLLDGEHAVYGPTPLRRTPEAA